MDNVIVKNRKALHDYFVEDTVEAGIMLVGCEVKSLRKGEANLKDSYVSIKQDGAYLLNAHISPYDKGSYFNVDAKRDRKLLLNKSELIKLKSKVAEKGYTLIPLSLYFKGALVKVELALCKGKMLHDKRASLAEKQTKREMEREIKNIKNLQ